MQLPKIQSDIKRSVADLMIQGYALSDIVEKIQFDNKEITRETIVSVAMDFFRDASKVDEDFRSGWCAEAYRELYRKMVEIGDFAGAKDCVKMIGELAKRNSCARSNA